jgi:hypothetical protein
MISHQSPCAIEQVIASPCETHHRAVFAQAIRYPQGSIKSVRHQDNEPCCHVDQGFVQQFRFSWMGGHGTLP